MAAKSLGWEEREGHEFYSCGNRQGGRDDRHLKAVLEFMWANVPTDKVIGVANSLPEMARLLWPTKQETLKIGEKKT